MKLEHKKWTYLQLQLISI